MAKASGPPLTKAILWLDKKLRGHCENHSQGDLSAHLLSGRSEGSLTGAPLALPNPVAVPKKWQESPLLRVPPEPRSKPPERAAVKTAGSAPRAARGSGVKNAPK